LTDIEDGAAQAPFHTWAPLQPESPLYPGKQISETLRSMPAWATSRSPTLEHETWVVWKTDTLFSQLLRPFRNRSHSAIFATMAEYDARFERQGGVLILDSGRSPVRGSEFVGFAALLVMLFLMITSLQATHTYLYIASSMSSTAQAARSALIRPEYGSPR